MLEAGTRFSYKGSFGTVRWSGKLENYEKAPEQEWYGVEWDDPTRGSHNGEYKGVKYFELENPKALALMESDEGALKAGSFLKVHLLPAGNEDFVNQLYDRYSPVDSSSSGKEEEDELYVYTAGHHKVCVIIVGK
eukprot:TRINITY_DN567_c0_g1_i2.p4 TRINITY_DN567_c0_g1~~TRINITY_DN567_c0_g1_i2.p4  ORF type:complete len:135 (+),score=33.07 TRINITY_DN567_c0_g1_i2:499-903(+)